MRDLERRRCATPDCDNLATRKDSNRYDRFCNSCRKNPYRALVKKKNCRSCGFIAVHSAQLDVDHIDGNHFNNDVSNLQVLCANCHRLKTMVNGDHLFTNSEEQCLSGVCGI